MTPSLTIDTRSPIPVRRQLTEQLIASAGLPNITLVGASPAAGAASGRRLRQMDVIVCPSSAAEDVKSLTGSTATVMIDDRALDPRAVEMLAAVPVNAATDGTLRRLDLTVTRLLYTEYQRPPARRAGFVEARKRLQRARVRRFRQLQ